MCGIAGYLGSGNVVGRLLELLSELQHRGQESAGIAVLHENRVFSIFKSKGTVAGLVKALGAARIVKGKLVGGIGHVRYSTSGGYMDAAVQPVLVSTGDLKFAVAFNGTIANYRVLAKELNINLIADNDVSALSNMILKLALDRGGDVVEAIKTLSELVIGAYSLVILTNEPRLVIAKDPWGFRPLCYAIFDKEVYVSSETAALEALNIGSWVEVTPGQIVSISGGIVEKTYAKTNVEPSPCIFEYVYFSRPDSVFNGVSVYASRVLMGAELARAAPVEADVIVPIPDSGRAAALGFSRESGISLEEGVLAVKYSGRSFIMPPHIRDAVLRLKYGFVKNAVSGKRVVLVDDSVVRGTTIRYVVQRLRLAGSKEVHVRIASPPFRYPCFMGIDVPSEQDLLANHYTDTSEMARIVGADSLAFNTVEGLRRAVGLKGVCAACFTGVYPFRGCSLKDLKAMFSR